MNRVRFCVAAFLLVLLAVVPSVAKAHATYVSSDPGANAILPNTPAPTQVSIRVSESVVPESASIRVTNASGGRVDGGPVTVSPDGLTIATPLDPIGAGIYTVAWSAMSAVDGHFWADYFSFAIQNPDGSLPGPLPSSPQPAVPAISPLEVAFSFIVFLGLAIAFGAAVFGWFAWLPSHEENPQVDAEAGFRRIARWGQTGSLAFVLGILALTGTYLAQAPTFAWSSFAISLAARLAFGSALVGAFALSMASGEDGSPDRFRSGILASLVFGIGAIVATTLGAHASASAAFWPLGPVSDVAHLIGICAWVGGLLAILWTRPLLLEPEAHPFAYGVIARFSRYTFWSVGLVLVGGFGLALVLVGTLDALAGTVYGWFVLAKVALFAPLVGLGAWNRYRLLPRADEPATGVRPILRNVRLEVVLGAIILAVTAVLTALAPAATPSGPTEYVQHATRDGVRFDLYVSPSPTVPGVYVFQILLYVDPTGAIYGNGTNATLTFTNGTTVENVRMDGPHGANHFIANNVSALSRPGLWRIDLLLTRSDGFDIRVTFYVPISGG